MKTKLIPAIIFVASLFSYCKKKEKEMEVDTIDHKDIKGKVLNNCNDSGMANLRVSLLIDHGNDSRELLTVSDNDGNFIFKDVGLHSSKNYSYAIYIPSKSGGVSTNPELSEIGIKGALLTFNYSEADLFFKPRVSPKFQFLTVYCNKQPVTSINDTIILTYRQLTFHKNVQDMPYQFVISGLGNGQYTNNIPAYPMGKYIIDIDTKINGVHSFKKDSTYIGWGAQVTQTLNW